jgi:hypothetical protein
MPWGNLSKGLSSVADGIRPFFTCTIISYSVPTSPRVLLRTRYTTGQMEISNQNEWKDYFQ